MKYAISTIVTLFVASIVILAVSGCTVPATLPPDATPAQVQAAKLVAAQANFDRACTWANGAVATAQPIVPLLAPKLGDDGTLALNSLLVAIKTTCAKPLDIGKADAIVQNVYDIGGQVIALVIKAQQAT